MSQIFVLGSGRFTLGFELAGITNTVIAGAEGMQPLKQMKEFMLNKEVGIVVVEQELLDALDEHDRRAIEDSVKPVFIGLSAELKQESLRRMIMKSIGVDLLAKEQ